MAQDRIRYGMLGTGMIADWLAKGFAGSLRSELVAVASRTVDKAAQFAASHQVPKHYGSYEALLADPALQAVIVALPNSRHAEWTVRAADAGKHVLCEKPLAMTPLDCDRMAKACQHAGVQLMEAAMYRFQPQIAKVLEWIAAGRIGKVRLIRGTFCFPFKDLANIRLKPEMGGGCLFDLGFYPVDFALCMAGEMPSQACCFAVYGGQSKVEEIAAGCLHFPSGAAALFECGFAVDIRTTAEIIGETGSIQMPDPWTARGKTKEVLLLKARAVLEKAELPDPNVYTLEIDHFSECILRGQAPLRTLAATRATAATLDALARSAREGLSVGVA